MADLQRARTAAGLAAALAAALFAGCGGAGAGRPLAVVAPASLPAPSASHVVVMVMENEESTGITASAAPYVAALERRYGVAASSYAITHPSLPNYLALTSGSTHGISSDCTECSVSAPNIVDQLEGARISWAAYLEELPGPCFAGAGAGGYAKKHDPFAYYRDVAGVPSRCAHLRGFGDLAAALRAGRLPTFAWITPNLCDDGHDCSLASADGFLARTVPALLRELGPHGFLVLTWDEGSSEAGCCGGAHGGHVLTVVVGPDVRAHGRLHTPVDHYGVLASVERALGLPLLGAAADPRSGSLQGLFSRAPHVR